MPATIDLNGGGKPPLCTFGREWRMGVTVCMTINLSALVDKMAPIVNPLSNNCFKLWVPKTGAHQNVAIVVFVEVKLKVDRTMSMIYNL